eukprot:scaffold120188_cov37-Tisochrysis_lutea.AAC.1
MGSRFQRLRGLPSCASEEEGGGLSPARTATSSELTLLDAFRAALAHESLPSPTQIRRRSLGGRAHGLLSSAASSLHAHAQQTADEVPPQRLREAAHHSQLSDETVRSMHAEMLGALLQALPQAKAADAAAVAQEVAAASLHGTAARPLSARAARGGRSASRWTTPVLSTGSESDVQDAPAADVGDGDGATLSAGGQIEGLLSRLGSLKASREVLREQSLEEEAEAEAARLREMLLGISSVVGCPQASLIQSGPVVPSKTELLNGVGVASSVVASVSQSPSCSAHAERPRNVRPVADTLDTLELLEEHFPPHIAQLFSSESWELRVMAIDRLSLVLEDMLSGEDGVRKRGVAIVGDASSVSPLSSVPSSPDSSDAPPRFWAKAAPIHPGRLHSRRLHIGAPLEEESESEGEQELEVGEMSEMGAPETRVTGEQVRAEADNSTGAKEQGLAESGPLLVEPSPREVEMLQAVCWMLRDALADAEARVAAAALEALSPAKPLLDLLVPRCAPREVRYFSGSRLRTYPRNNPLPIQREIARATFFHTTI